MQGVDIEYIRDIERVFIPDEGFSHTTKNEDDEESLASHFTPKRWYHVKTDDITFLPQLLELGASEADYAMQFPEEGVLPYVTLRHFIVRVPSIEVLENFHYRGYKLSVIAGKLKRDYKMV
jgi:hypothetical protein